MRQTILYVEKDTDLMRSTFVAIGLAELLYRLPGTASGKDVRIYDQGSSYQLVGDLSPEDYRAEVIQRGFLPPLLPALTKKLTGAEQRKIETGSETLESIRDRYVPEGFRGTVIDYEEERQKVKAHRALRKEGLEEGQTSSRNPDFSLWAHLMSDFNRGTIMRVGYPLMLHIWHSHTDDQAVALFDVILQAYSNFPNNLIAAQLSWQEFIKSSLTYDGHEQFGWGGTASTVNALSLVSPSTAQGSATPSGVRLPNTTIPDTFWLEFYLALAGYMVAGIPYRSGNDALLYYPIPQNIRFSRLNALMIRYRGAQIARDLYDYSGLMPRAKVDALSMITFYLEMVRHYLANPSSRRRIDSISGLVGYFYKNLTGHAPFDETIFGLPPWIPRNATQDELYEAESILEAHHNIIYKALRGDHADELIILDHYRQFATEGQPDKWIEFVIAYNLHRFRKMVDAGWMPQLTVELLRRTMMGVNDRRDYSPIFEDAGFNNIAKAIRYCTVQLRYWKDVKKTQTAFRVRHGLGEDLRRHAHDPDRFIAALSEFVADYMRESSNVQASTNETRPFITQDDLQSVARLVYEYGSRVVANLLVAAGYSSDFSRETE